jgi:hypothetical protein
MYFEEDLPLFELAWGTYFDGSWLDLLFKSTTALYNVLQKFIRILWLSSGLNFSDFLNFLSS